MAEITNCTFDEILVGQSASYSRAVERREILLFAEASGDVNPLHLDADYATGTPFGEPIAHGLLSASLISAVIALQLPGPGTVYVGQTLRFLRPVKIGDRLTATVRVLAKREEKGLVTLDCQVVNQHDKAVVAGEAEVLAPREKVRVEAPVLPEIVVAEQS